MKKILIITSVVILSLIFIRFSITKFGEYMHGKQMQTTAIPTVTVKNVEEQEIYDSIEMPGRIESPDKVDLVARIDGYLQKKHFQEGDFVKKGQILFTIEPTQYLNNLNKAKADLKNAQAVFYKSKRDYERGAELVKRDFISKSTYDGLKADKIASEAQIQVANAQLAEAKRNYSYTTIKSPVDGKIGSLNIQEGNYVSINSGTLATVVKTNPVYVKYSVDSKQLEKLRSQDFIHQKGKENIKVDVILSDGTIYPIKGTQDFLDNQISETQGTIDFRATFANPNNSLIAGDFVKVIVYSNKKQNVLVVPQDVVLQDSKGRYIYTVDEKNIVQQKYFKDKGQYKNYWIIDSGLDKNDKYINVNITKLMPKMPVKIMTSEEANKGND